MKISEYITLLDALKNEHGDIDVQTYSFDSRRIEARHPTVDYTKILKGRESKPTFWSSWEPEDRKGEKVCRV